MKNLGTGIFCMALAMAGGLSAQPAATSDGGTMFPEHWVRGYIDFQVSPPGNEPDLGRCAAFTTVYGAKAPCAAFARYMMGGYVEAQPFGKTVLRHVFLFAQPLMSMGNNVPQVSYTASADPIAMDSTLGIGFELSKHFELRAARHQVYWLGRYNHYLGFADVGPGGLYGVNATLGARYYFGGWGRERE
ncbi:MAG TPA: hypothetical protein VMU19_12265 [Bryobacteraceae bacterium]|nr:hypothetical protein [Bryobacteraceae bacterium]